MGLSVQQQDDPLVQLDLSIKSAIQQTERYYREQIFSSGCSSIVPIYKVGSNIRTAKELMRQLDGSPYIQSDVEFSGRVIETLLDVDIYRFDQFHFFVNGAINSELSRFIEEQCQQVESLSSVARAAKPAEPKAWAELHKDLNRLLAKYPVLNNLDCVALVKCVLDVISHFDFEESIEQYLNLFSQSELGCRLSINQSSLLCMVAMGQELRWKPEAMRELILLGVLKDIGYARLNEQIMDFEVLHPLVSHKILEESNRRAQPGKEMLSPLVLESVLLHHEFTDGSGPLARMRHPIVNAVIAEGMPDCAQISGICDLYFGFLEKYSPGVAYAITCGFVLGQGDLQPRYNVRVIAAFMAVLRDGSYSAAEVDSREAEMLISNILGVLKDPKLKSKAFSAINAKSTSWYDRITLALNIVRNISVREPTRMCENSLVGALYLPLEFGINY